MPSREHFRPYDSLPKSERYFIVYVIEVTIVCISISISKRRLVFYHREAVLALVVIGP